MAGQTNPSVHAPLSCKLNSFTAETPVEMADGSSKPISDVEVGDLVLATDPETGESGPRPVAALIRHGGDHTMVNLTFNDGSVIESTDEHPFWDVTDQEFTFAVDLEVGDVVLSIGGDQLRLVSTRVYVEDLWAYNLRGRRHPHVLRGRDAGVGAQCLWSDKLHIDRQTDAHSGWGASGRRPSLAW